MARYDALAAKWATLSGTTAQKLAAIDVLTVTLPAQPMVIPTYEIYNVIVPSEWAALTTASQQNIRDILGLGNVDTSAGTQARAVILSIFGAATQTRAALVALAAPYDSPKIAWWQASVAEGGGGLTSPVTMDDLAAAGLS